ncbi:MAG: SDR family oxidoreductase [Kineosporiaceae bacterium]|nr:SDR family oxidoreductase [Aeromicrobium sp.]
MSRWLVTGASGLLGSNAMHQLSLVGGVVGSARTSPASNHLPFISANLEDADSRSGLIARSGAEVVLHAAAVASIEACATDPVLARIVNVDAAADLARQAKAEGAKFIYVSTDAVFNGRRGNYLEEDPTSPTSEYGRTKVSGERAVLDANPEAMVARVNFYGWSPSGRRSLAEFFYHRLLQGEQTPGFTDVTVSTLQVGYLVEALVALASLEARGIVHVASSEPTTKFDFGRRLADEFGLDANLVVPGRSTDHLVHDRGSSLSLNTNLATKLLGTPMARQRSGLHRLYEELNQALPATLRRLSITTGN